MDINKKIALIAAGSLLSVGGLYAVSTSANAVETPTAPAITSPVAGAEAQDAADTDDLQEGNQNKADEVGETESASDGPDQGPDMDASEAGHQDAPGADDATEGAEVAGK
jgi:hypothetical protein